MVYDSMTDAAVSCCEKLDSQLSDLDAVLDMVSTVMASPEASLHINEATRLLLMSRGIVHRCKDVIEVERSRQECD